MSAEMGALRKVADHLRDRGDRVLAVSSAAGVIFALVQRGVPFVVLRTDDGETMDEVYRMPELDRAWRQFQALLHEVETLKEVALGNRADGANRADGERGEP